MGGEPQPRWRQPGRNRSLPVETATGAPIPFPYSAGFDVPGAPAPPNGAVAPGQTLDGALAYDVPAGQTYLFHFKNELLLNGDVAVNLGQR